MTEHEIQTRVNAIAAKVTMAGQAVETATEAAAAGFDPRGVWQAAADVVDSAVQELRRMQSRELSRQGSEMVKNVKVTFR